MSDISLSSQSSSPASSADASPVQSQHDDAVEDASSPSSLLIPAVEAAAAVVALPAAAGKTVGPRKKAPIVDGKHVALLCSPPPQAAEVSIDFHSPAAITSYGACVMQQAHRNAELEHVIAESVVHANKHVIMSYMGVACPTERFEKGCVNLQVSSTLEALENARNVVASIPGLAAGEARQLPSSFFIPPLAKEEIPMYYSCRGNNIKNWTALVPLNPEGATISFFAHGMEQREAWQKLSEEQSATMYKMSDSMCAELEKHKANMCEVHVKQGEMFITHGGMCFTFHRHPFASAAAFGGGGYIIQAITYEMVDPNKRRFNTWRDMLNNKGFFNVRDKFGMEQLSGLAISPILKAADMAARISEDESDAPVAADWLTSAPGGGVKKQRKKASPAPPVAAPPPAAGGAAQSVVAPAVAGADLLARAQTLNFRVWDKAHEVAFRTAQESGDKRKAKTGLDRFKIRLEEAEKANVEAMVRKFDECTRMLQELKVPESAPKILKSLVKAKTLYAALEHACFIGKEKKIDELHDQLVHKVKDKLSASPASGGGGQKKRKVAAAAAAAPAAAKIISGPELAKYAGDMYTFLESLSDVQKKQPQMQQLKFAFDVMFESMSEPKNDNNPDYAYDVGPLDALKSAPPPQAAAAGATKCHKKNGGCGKTVPSLLDDVCLLCFKIHLKSKVEDVSAMFKSLKKHDTGAYEESADLRSRIERAYVEVFPEKKNVAPASPLALAALIKEALRLYSTDDDDGGIVNMEEDLDAMEDDEEEEDDEEDDSLVVPNDFVSYESDASSSSSSGDDEKYDSKRNSNKKRERKEDDEATLTVHAVAHRILLARHRTPIESRLNELYELHFKASTAPNGAAQLLTAADVKLTELEQLTRVYCIMTTYNNKQHQHPFFFFTEEEAEGKLALLEKMTSGLTGRVEEKKLE